MRNAFVNTLLNLAKSNKNLILITGDLGFGVLTKFWEEYPNQFINAGICEQNMTSVAAGMALEGKIVFTYSIANFPTLRCLEQIRNDVCYHDCNVKIVSVGGGFAYGSSGMSHHATEDIAQMRVFPNMKVFTPCDANETEAVTDLAFKEKGPCYIRLGKGENIHLNSFIPFKATKILNGNDISIFACGSIVNEGIKASEALKSKGVSSSVYSFHSVKPIDEETIIKVANEVEYIVTIEDHSIIGGFGGAVSEILSENRVKAIQVRIGLIDTFSSVVGTEDYLREYYSMNSNKIVERILEIMNS